MAGLDGSRVWESQLGFAFLLLFAEVIKQINIYALYVCHLYQPIFRACTRFLTGIRGGRGGIGGRGGEGRGGGQGRERSGGRGGDRGGGVGG